MKVKGKRTLKNGAVAGYVEQKDGTYKWRIIKGPNKSKKKTEKKSKKGGA